MDEKRKAAYRDLVYHGLVMIRSGPRGISWLKPWRIPSEIQEMKRIKEFADALHNLAFFSSFDFERFEEKRFWEDAKRVTPYKNQTIEELLRKRFKWYLAESSEK